jgi:hypothetical protein
MVTWNTRIRHSTKEAILALLAQSKLSQTEATDEAIRRYIQQETEKAGTADSQKGASK